MSQYRSQLWHRFQQWPADEQSRLIEMAWEDRTPFDAIEAQFGMTEADVIRLMQRLLKPVSFRNWRARVSQRTTKHLARRSHTILRSHCPTQYKHR
ncbi:TIGR03643 family protein [Saccharospirillum impatiens]|uniref:TIGR03643 family protein n=1 Tax=Saccharospirillum impatiens TaxID=169438 RepID=UPI000412D00E|nr:TIGR03643 family protein [Saccharospirillum impatiens]